MSIGRGPRSRNSFTTGPRASKRGAPMPKAKRKRAIKKKSRFTAKTADKHVLYQLSVQAPDTEVDF